MNQSFTPQPLETIKPAIYMVCQSGDHYVHSYKTEEDRQAALDMALRMGQRDGIFTRIDTCNKREIGWSTPNRAAIDTGCKAFDKKFTGVMFGNVISGTVLSLFVRGGQNLACNGRQYNRGELLELDLNGFGRKLDIQLATRWVRQHQKDAVESVLLAVIYHHYREGGCEKHVTHGAFVMGRDRSLIKRFDRDDLFAGYRAKSVSIMDTVQPFFTNECVLDRQLAWSLH